MNEIGTMTTEIFSSADILEWEVGIALACEVVAEAEGAVEVEAEAAVTSYQCEEIQCHYLRRWAAWEEWAVVAWVETALCAVYPVEMEEIRADMIPFLVVGVHLDQETALEDSGEINSLKSASAQAHRRI